MQTNLASHLIARGRRTSPRWRLHEAHLRHDLEAADGAHRCRHRVDERKGLRLFAAEALSRSKAELVRNLEATSAARESNLADETFLFDHLSDQKQISALRIHGGCMRGARASSGMDTSWSL